MNSFTGNSKSGAPSSSSSASLKNYEFDFGLGSNFSSRGPSRPLREQKNPVTSPNPSSSFPSRPLFSSSSSSSSSWAPNKPSWTHQPSPSATAANPPRSELPNPTFMVGDIFGKSWTSGAPAAGLGIPKSDPSLFGDLVGSALGQGKNGGGSGSVPLKAASPRNSYSMENLADSLPKTAAANNPVKPTSWGSAENLGSYYSSAGSRTGNKIGNPSGGQPMKSSGVSMNTKKDPFGSFVDFGSKPSVNPSPAVNSNSNYNGSSGDDYSFGAFQNVNLPKMDNFGAKMDELGRPPVQDFPSQKPPPSQPMGGVDPLDMLFSSSPAAAASASAEGSGRQPFAEANDWDLGAEFGGSDAGGATTELEGLPPPPAGVTSSMAQNKGLDNYKHGQYADAIKWLSWAVVLLDKPGDSSATTEVLSCRASCYKEVGEYKKAVADCSKVLELDGTNVTVLLQRALLYESTEKYKLGAEDLRAVLKIDPSNRLAKSTIHRLIQLAG